MTTAQIFRRCVEATAQGHLITRESSRDKEFHFQHWFGARLEELGDPFEVGSRNSYPDFRMVATTDGYELKGLAYPGRDATFDSNSQMPTGFHNGRTVYYVFGRYPSQPDGNTYPLLDLVICHGDFLNANHDYVHKNRSVRAFGSYGDIMIRDRKMYVVPTPFRLIDGAAHHQTLILPADDDPGEDFTVVGELLRVEVDEIVVGYTFDLVENTLESQRAPNPNAGREHMFRAWRVQGAAADGVSLRRLTAEDVEAEAEAEE
jgi:hypothetical protein